MAPGPTTPGTLAPRTKRREGVVAIIERDSAAVCEIAVENGVRLRRGAIARNGVDKLAWSLGDPASVAAALATLLERARLPPRIDSLTLPQSLFGVNCTVLPPVQGDALRALVTHRLREAMPDAPNTTGAQGEWLVDSTPIGNPGDEEAESTPVVLAWADRVGMDALDTAFHARRLDVRRIVPPMVGLLNTLGHARGAGTNDALLVVHVSLPSLCIFLFDGEDLLYLRPLRDVLAAAPEQLPDVVTTEVQRTASYFRENQRGRRIEQVLISGLPRSSSERFCTWLSGNVALRCAPLAIAREDGRTTPIDDDALAAHLPVLAGILLPAARPHVTKALPINLLPRAPRKPLFIAAVASAVVLCVAAALGARASWSSEAADRRQWADALGIDLAKLEASKAGRESALADARRFAAERRALATVADGAANPMQPVLEAMALVPAGLELVATKFARPAKIDSIGAGDGGNAGAATGPVAPRLELHVGGDFTRNGPQLVDQFVTALGTRPWCARAQTLLDAGGAAADSTASRAATEQVCVEVTLR